jgi:DNA polymerase-3 subunit delta'
MTGLAIHPATQRQLNHFAKAPAQALILTGPSGGGKTALATQLAEDIIGLPAGTFASYAYGIVIRPEEGKSIGIEPIRSLEHFLSLKVPTKSAYNRVAIITDGHLMTREAQNALLKNLEEPPAGTVVILTASHDKALLPTIRSRAQLVAIQKPSRDALGRHFDSQDFDAKAISQAYAISGGLPGLMHALLSDQEHPLLAATEQARQLLSQPAHQRLLSVDALSKQRALTADMIDIMQQMAHVSLRTARGDAAKRWQAVQTASYEAAEALRSNAQPKLVLTDLVLQF